MSEFRNIIYQSNKIAVGCSHTWGCGVEAEQTWPYLLDAMNFGVGACSSDYVARKLPTLIEKYQPTTVYVLWPDWTRFEYLKNGHYVQSLPTDKDRILFMETATDKWLQNNFLEQVDKVKNICSNIELIDMTLYDLIPFIDYSDKWPISKLGHHYSEEWHRWVANIFKNEAKCITDHRLFA